MLIRAVLILMLMEIGTFSLAALCHLGVSLFGFAEPRGYLEAVVQMMMGLFIAISAHALWKRKYWEGLHLPRNC